MMILKIQCHISADWRTPEENRLFIPKKGEKIPQENFLAKGFSNHPKGWFFVAKYIYQDHHKMAEIKTTRVWDGLTVDEYTDTSTGKIEIRVAGGDTVLASSSNSQWTIDDEVGFTSLYNARPGARVELDTDEFEEIFQDSGVPLFNDDRANVLNNERNYGSFEISENNRTQFAQVNRIPGVTDPVTGQLVNQDGSITDGDPFANVGDTQTADGGDPSSTSDGYQNPNFPWSRNSGQFVRGFSVGRSGGAAGLRYPLYSNADDDLDYLKVDIRSYRSNGLEQSASGGASQGVIYLPMQPGLSEARIVDWQDDKMNFIQKVAAQAAMQGMDGIADIMKGELGTGMSELGGAVSRLGEGVSQFAGDDRASSFIKAYMAQQIVGSNIIGRTTGAVLNPNLELLFNGPKLRSFQYTYLMTARDEAESNVIRQIIYKLKMHSAPKGMEQDVFLKSPDLFQLEYIYGPTGAQHPFMHKFKECALTNIGVDYTPDGSYMTYGNGSMTAYRLNLTFQEIKPVYDKDYMQGGDGSSDMGF